MEIDEEYLNAFLVHTGVRPAMLLQPADYNEAVSTDPVSAGKLAKIATAFPDLVYSNISGETLIAKRAYTEAEIPSSTAMGRFLGYPCADEFESLDHDGPRVGIEIVVVSRSGQRFQIVAYFCKDESKVPDAVHFATAAEAAFRSDPRLSAIVDHVELTRRIDRGPTYYINRLLAKEPLSEEDKGELINHIWNLGLEHAVRYAYDFENPIHRGILIGLLAFCKHDPSEPFFPLQDRPEYAAVMGITAKLDHELERIFAAPRVGGRRTTRRRKPTGK
jgi:hypothetical protein